IPRSLRTLLVSYTFKRQEHAEGYFVLPADRQMQPRLFFVFGRNEFTSYTATRWLHQKSKNRIVTWLEDVYDLATYCWLNYKVTNLFAFRSLNPRSCLSKN